MVQATSVQRVLERASEVGLKIPSGFPVESKLFLIASSPDEGLRGTVVATIRDTSGAIGLANLFNQASADAPRALALDALGQLALSGDRSSQIELLRLRGMVQSEHPTLAHFEQERTATFHDLFSKQAHHMPALVAYLSDTSGGYSQLSAMCDRSSANPGLMMKCAAQSSGPTRVALLGALANSTSTEGVEVRREAIHQLAYEGTAGLRALFTAIRPAAPYDPSKTALAQEVIERRLRNNPADSAVLKELNLSSFDQKFINKLMLVVAETGQVSVANAIAQDKNQMPSIRREAAAALCTMTAPRNTAVDNDARKALVSALKDLALSNDFQPTFRASFAGVLGTKGLPPGTAARAALDIVRARTGPVHDAMLSAARLVSEVGVSTPLGKEIVETLRSERRSFGHESKSAAQALKLLGLYGSALSKWDGCMKWAGLLRESVNDLLGAIRPQLR